MKLERWHAIEELYYSASDVPENERNSFLHEACGEDQSLFSEVESLLRHGSTPQSVLDTPAIAIMAKAIAAHESQTPAPSLEGKTISHYQVLEKLGGGGMGWSIRLRISLRRSVALKLLPQFLQETLKHCDALNRRAGSFSLNHPNICTVYRLGS
jgi:hypothetical protein